jgi:hypothetical protein
LDLNGSSRDLVSTKRLEAIRLAKVLEKAATLALMDVEKKRGEVSQFCT